MLTRHELWREDNTKKHRASQLVERTYGSIWISFRFSNLKEVCV